MPRLSLRLAILVLLSTNATPVIAQQHAGHSLGTVNFPVTCTAEAQTEFNRAVALLHHMTYPQAREAFEHVATVDPRCAMAHWGIAMTLFQPLWPTRPALATRQRGWDVVQKARQLQPANERERLFIASAEAFFVEPSSNDYWLRIRRWEQATRNVHDAFPDDAEAAAFYALSHLATTPSDTITRAHADRAAPILLRVFEKNPDHPGAMHYLVHANDVPGREREMLEITRQYDAVAPGNPHALHMPTHIYTRVGDWDAVIRGNLRSADAALQHPGGARGELVSDQFPHAVEYLIYAQLQKGADDEARRQLERLRQASPLEPTFITAFHVAATPARYALERRAWTEAAALEPRQPATLDWDRFAWPEAIVWFARGLGSAHLGRVDEVKAASERIGNLEETTRTSGEELFARSIRVLRLELLAWLSHMEGRADSSAVLMREAARLEASTPKHAVTPGPVLPSEELWGDLYMEQRQPTQALAAYQRSLDKYPGRFNGLLGAARAARALGNSTLARTYYTDLIRLAEGGQRRAVMDEAQSFVRQR